MEERELSLEAQREEKLTNYLRSVLIAYRAERQAIESEKLRIFSATGFSHSAVEISR